MKQILIVAMLCVIVVMGSSWNDTPLSISTENESLNTVDSLADERAAYVSEIMETIKGKEKMPADSVFKNIKVLKNVTAERLLMIMDRGWSNALNVNCNHCHNTHDWASEEKSDKQIARDMVVMTNKINSDLLKKIEGLEKSSVNCSTCHRGEKKPGRSGKKKE